MIKIDFGTPKKGFKKMSKGSNRRRENTAQFNEFYKQVKWPERITNKQWRNIWYAIKEFIEQERGNDD